MSIFQLLSSQTQTIPQHLKLAFSFFLILALNSVASQTVTHIE